MTLRNKNESFLIITADLVNMKNIMDRKSDDLSPIFMAYMMIEIAKKTVESNDVQKLLSDPKEHFDAVIVVEWMFSDVTAG